jgi:hypothetical protein
MLACLPIRPQECDRRQGCVRLTLWRGVSSTSRPNSMHGDDGERVQLKLTYIDDELLSVVVDKLSRWVHGGRLAPLRLYSCLYCLSVVCWSIFSIGFGFQSVHTLASPGSASQTANMNINVSHRIRMILMETSQLTISQQPLHGRAFALPFSKAADTDAELTDGDLRLPFVHRVPDSIRNHFVAMCGEYVGTVLFLFFALSGTQVANTIPSTGGRTVAEAGANPQQLQYIALCFGFSLAVNAWVFFRISGGLFNPAVCITWF